MGSNFESALMEFNLGLQCSRELKRSDSVRTYAEDVGSGNYHIRAPIASIFEFTIADS